MKKGGVPRWCTSLIDSHSSWKDLGIRKGGRLRPRQCTGLVDCHCCWKDLSKGGGEIPRQCLD